MSRKSMSMAGTKVVKLEEVEQEEAGLLDTDRSLLKSVIKKTSICDDSQRGNSRSTSAVHSKRGSSVSEAGTESGCVDESEAEDKVYPLPENWPKISLLKLRPRSCELSLSRMPCVKKAVSHIELIQNIIDEWFKRLTEDIKSRASSRHSSAHGVKKQLRFQDLPDETYVSSHGSPSYKGSTVSRASSSRLSGSTAELSVTGKGTHQVEEVEEEVIDVEEIPYLGAQDVIDEVITLLARLESDRQDTQENYMKEIEKAEKLRQKIDEWQLKRMRELPSLVQREHEACIVDLNELHWHVSFAKRNEAKAQTRFSTAERLNTQLKEDIAFVKQHVPLVQEKLILEMEAMEKIRKAQGETDQELVMTKQRQAKTEMKSTEALTKAETERGHIKKELDSVRDDLTNISEELTEAKMTYNAFVHQVNDIHSQLTDNDQELKVLRVKNENARTAEEMQATKVRDLQAKITEAEFEHRRLENENEQLEQELKMNKNRNFHKLQDLERQLKALEAKYRIVSRKNQELSMEIEDCEEKIKKCDRQKTADEKNINRINREIERTASMLHHTMEEHHRISTVNHHIRDQLSSEQDKAFRTEETLKTTTETLRRQVKDEIHTRTVLQARINSDTAEIEKVKTESAKKKGKAKSVADDVEQAVSGVLQKVEQLRVAKQEKEQRMNDLKSKLEETQNQHQESSDRFHQTLGRIEPRHQMLTAEVSDLTKKLDHMEWRTQLMKNKMEEMDAAQGMMERSVRTSEQAITTLTAELDELNLQIEAGKKIEEDLRKQYNETLERLRGNENKHGNLLKDRQDVLKKHEVDKARFIEKNKELASRYRQLQNDYVICKEQMLRSYDERVKIEATITDVKQLKSLQSKLHGALAEYFKLSGLYNEAELSKLEQESSVNGVRVSELQLNMEHALDDISEFISSQMDGKVARQMAWDAVKRKSVVDAGDLGLGDGLPATAATTLTKSTSHLGSRQVSQVTVVQ
ncbi:coiled-coil domain-containing protein 178 [Aplysia californica]|uniref:Coiled-coil domain-containing protein 178 n=1 Tax=Aplysia californica TaxID=6500 RepID=A0ABM0JPF5_APLCA|nr:coiled-coil domain-containing protein 178 [Aplysia californica]